MEVRYHCTDQFWYRWDHASSRLTRHVHNMDGTLCMPLCIPLGVPLASPPLFFGGAVQSSEDRCFTEDLGWKIDLKTMRACRFRTFEGMKIKTLCGSPGAAMSVAMVTDKEVPLMFVSQNGTQWLPEETVNVTRASPCDVTFNRVALYMSHTKQVIIWNRENNTLTRFPTCPGISDFVTCCYTHKIYAITYNNGEQRMVTLDVDVMDMADSRIIGETGQSYGRIFARPCFPTIATTPYVTADDREDPVWNISDSLLALVQGSVHCIT